MKAMRLLPSTILCVPAFMVFLFASVGTVSCREPAQVSSEPDALRSDSGLLVDTTSDWVTTDVTVESDHKAFEITPFDAMVELVQEIGSSEIAEVDGNPDVAVDALDVVQGDYLDVPCIPDCVDKECGNDGCDGWCGQCVGAHNQCLNGACQCVPFCSGKLCGSDGCGGTCTCTGGKWCNDGVCTNGLCEIQEVEDFSVGIGDFAVANGHVYVASSRDMFVFTESPQTNESWVARSSFDYYLRDIAARDDLVVVVGESPEPLSGLTVLDVSQPASPQVVGELALPYAFNNTVDLELHDQHAFFVRLYQGLYAVSLEDPGSPVVTAVLEDVPWPKGLTISNGLAYVAGFDGLYIVDIANPADMTVVGFRHHGFEGKYGDVHGMRALSVWENTLVAIVNAGGLVVFDVSDPSAPTLMYSEPFLDYWLQDVQMLPGLDMALVGSQYLMDVSTPSSPGIVGEIKPWAPHSWTVYASLVKDDRLFLRSIYSVVATSMSSLLDSSFEEVLSLPSGFDGVVAVDGTAHTLDGSHQKLYGLDYAGIQSLSASYVSSVEDEDVTFHLLEGAGNYLYLIGDNSDCSDPDSVTKVQAMKAVVDTVPVSAGEVEVPGETQAAGLAAHKLFVGYNLSDSAECAEAYISESGLHVISLTDPAAPHWVGTWAGVPFISRSLATTEDRVILAWRSPYGSVLDSFGITILDVSDPSLPVLLGSWTEKGFLGHTPEVSIAGGYIILMTKQKEYSSIPGVFLFNQEDETTPSPVATDELLVSSIASALSHGYLVRADDGPVLSVFDPSVLPTFQLNPISNEEGWGTRTASVAQGHVFIPSSWTLQVFDVTGCWW